MDALNSYHIIILVVIAVFVLTVVITAVQKNKKAVISSEDPVYKDIIVDMQAFVSKLKSAPEEYITATDRANLKGAANELIERLKHYTIKKAASEYEFFKYLTDFKCNADTIIDNRNEDFIKSELIRCSSLFDNIGGKSLDMQQRRAVITDELHNLIVAGAGSGKTLTVVGKVAYLCDMRDVKPEEILLISFTNKAAVEMTERAKQLGYAVEATTFHALGLKIISESLGYRPNVIDNLQEEIETFLINSIFNDADAVNNLINFYAYYLTIPTDLNEAQSLGAAIDAEHSADYETLKSKYYNEDFRDKKSLNGERLKSLEEVMIANFLFLNGVNYTYERKYPYSTGDRYRNYNPDFYLDEYDIYLEHFGVNVAGKCPWLSEIEEKKYTEGMIWKRDLHKKHCTKLIETYSYYQSQGVLLKQLQSLLLQNKVVFHPLDPAEVLKKLQLCERKRSIKEFNQLLCTFIKLYKSKGFQSDGFCALYSIAKEEKSPYLKNRATTFLCIAEKVYIHYQEVLSQNNAVDFSDMIIQAKDAVKSESYYPSWKYIIIDEYQDIGADRYCLIKEIINKSVAKLMCVGDDWQSIYRFAGADVNYFSDFKGYWGASEILKIEHTYRNSQELLDIAGTFIMENLSQTMKTLRSDFHQNAAVQIIYYKDQTGDAVIAALDLIIRDVGDTINNKDGYVDVLLLGRTKYDFEGLCSTIEEGPDNNLLRKGSGSLVYKRMKQIRISFLTVHKAKGLEADYVIILNAKNDMYGFPNKLADDPILRYVLSAKEEYDYAEERRLFYVALTRTKRIAFIAVPDKNPSEFIESIKDKCLKRKVSEEQLISDNPNCPKCKTGKLVVKENNNTKQPFVACSHYPSCDFRTKNFDLNNPLTCPKCGGFMVKKPGKYGEFYGCCNYSMCEYTMNISVDR